MQPTTINNQDSESEGEVMARRTLNPELTKVRKIEKRLGELDYTPQAAKMLAGFLRGLSADEPDVRERRLQAFRDLSHPLFGEYRK